MSEETEVKKDKEWLKEEVNKILRDKVADGINYYDYMDLKNSLNELTDQLDEPEVLSHKWINDNAVVGQYQNSIGYVVPTYKLQNLLVPKQELPVIPKFVAEWLEQRKGHFTTIFNAIGYLSSYGYDDEAHVEHKLYEWLPENEELFVMAWNHGFTVEEEQKYILSINITDKVSKTNYETFLNKRSILKNMRECK